MTEAKCDDSFELQSGDSNGNGGKDDGLRNILGDNLITFVLEEIGKKEGRSRMMFIFLQAWWNHSLKKELLKGD